MIKTLTLKLRIPYSIIYYTIIIIGILSISATNHPIHLSYTKIHIEDNHLKIVSKIYSHDFEYMEFSSFTDSSKQIQVFFTEMFNIRSDNHIIDLPLDSIRIQEGIHWLYFSTNIPQNSQEIQVHNAILCSVYEDQQNLIIISINNIEKGYILDCKNKKIHLTL